MQSTIVPNFSIIIPMHNEADNVRPLIQEIQQAFPESVGYEIIVVDDGSTDETSKHLNELQASNKKLRIVRHRRNYGQSTSIVSGVYAAQTEWIATLDGDGQNDPADIPKLMALIGPHSDGKTPLLISGNRTKRDDGLTRRYSSFIANKIRGRMLRDHCPDSASGLKLFRREDFLKLPHFDHLHRFLPALFIRSGGKVINIPVNHRARTRGKSKYGIKNRLWIGIIDMIGVFWLIRRPCLPEMDTGIVDREINIHVK